MTARPLAMPTLFNDTGTDAGAAAQAAGQNIGAFLGSLGAAAAVFGVEMLVCGRGELHDGLVYSC